MNLKVISLRVFHIGVRVRLPIDEAIRGGIPSAGQVILDVLKG